jgi:ankyrin repeat protein
MIEVHGRAAFAIAVAALMFCSGSQAQAQDTQTNAPTLGDQLIQDAKDGSVAKVQQDLANGADVNSRHSNGRTALMLNAEWDHDSVDVIDVLLDHGANVNAKDNDGHTALMWAVEMDEPNVVRLLVEHGADVNARANDGTTPLSLAEAGDEITGVVDEVIIRLLRGHGAQ